ncbi:hypothetical protein PN36_12605 [Candidatus Thiomargarita nelsonii]|uniref:Secreted protein n=1 Tax=Candidatus Thiomargarita nelsonii TaxID=1003181 RepID=A0A4E0R2P1_9GAMM|nr:hypothetical protein PN36_12605 [Candidatus Thiomargarita nelsonii]
MNYLKLWASLVIFFLLSGMAFADDPTIPGVSDNFADKIQVEFQSDQSPLQEPAVVDEPDIQVEFQHGVDTGEENPEQEPAEMDDADIQVEFQHGVDIGEEKPQQSAPVPVEELQELEADTGIIGPESSTLWFYNADSELLQDNDGDGYHRKFKITLDADTLSGYYANVYVKLYIRRGSESYSHYYTSSVFRIEQNSSSDAISITTTLNSGVPSDYYDIQAKLYLSDGSYHDTRDASNDSDLNNLKLEDATRDDLFARISDARSELLQDEDGDGYHRKFKITFDVQASNLFLYAKLYIRQGSGSYVLYYTTSKLTVPSSGTYSATTTLNSGYPTDLYDIQIKLYGYNSHTLYDTRNASNDSSLNNLKLEDATRDDLFARISDARRELLQDEDGDGYHRKFKITFDVQASNLLLYAKLYIRQGSGSYVLYYTTPQLTHQVEPTRLPQHSIAVIQPIFMIFRSSCMVITHIRFMIHEMPAMILASII